MSMNMSMMPSVIPIGTSMTITTRTNMARTTQAGSNISTGIRMRACNIAIRTTQTSCIFIRIELYDYGTHVIVYFLYSYEQKITAIRFNIP